MRIAIIGGNGFAVENDAEVRLAKICYVLEDTVWYTGMAQTARWAYLEEFTVEVEKWEVIYG